MMKKNLMTIAVLAAVLASVSTFRTPVAATPMNWIASWLGTQVVAAVPSRTVDGNKADWHNVEPPIGDAAMLDYNGTDTEWVWTDKFGDVRHAFADWGNWDIERIHVIASDQYLYLLVEVDNITNANNFQMNIAMDTQIATSTSGGTTGLDWFGDDAGTLLASPEQKSEFNIIADGEGVWIFNVYTNSWNWAANSGTWIVDNGSDDFMELKLKWSDLGFSAVPARLRFTMGTANRNGVSGDPDDWWVDKTAEVVGSSDMLDVASFGKYNCTDDWQNDLSDGNVATYVDIAFDANGNCNNPKIPAAPTNFRALDGTDSVWHVSGDTLWTNNPILRWDAVLPDGDAGDSIVGYYIQVCTSPVVNANGFFHGDWATVVNKNTTGTGPFNRIVCLNSDAPGKPQAWWGAADSTTGIRNRTGTDYEDLPILVPGNTYYIRVWARDRRGMLGAASATYVMPIDLPSWHDPYVFTQPSISISTTFRGNRDPKEGAFVNFIVGVFDPAPRDPRDGYFNNPGPAGGTAVNEILNVILHIKRSDQTWAAAGRVLMGNHWKDSISGDIAWYLPNIWNNTLGANDPPDSYSYWRTDENPTDGDPDLAKTWLYKAKSVNLGGPEGVSSGTLYLGASAGSEIEYFFELNNPFEAPGSAYLLSGVARRFLHAYDTRGITGYRAGTYEDAQANPLRFVVQKRDLPAVWHNPLSNEVPLAPGGDSYLMRTPAWPDTSPQTVKMYIGGIGYGLWSWQMVWRNVGNGGWNVAAFNPAGVQTDTDHHLYYYNYDFTYPGGMIEYYFKMVDNSCYIFANGITDNLDTVYTSSIGNEGQETVPFKFPFTSAVRVTSTATDGKDSHSMVAVLHFRAPRLEAIDENAIGINGILNLNSCSATVTGNVFTNAFPGAHNARSDTPGAPEPRNVFGRSYVPLMAGVINVVAGLRKAFFGPVSPFDYSVADSSQWNTGSDAYENVPILTFLEVFAGAVEKDMAAGTVFNVGEPLEGVIYVDGDATVSTLTITRGALICSGSITIPAAAVVTATRLDLFALGGTVRISGRLEVDTGIIFSNRSIIIDTSATVKLKKMGSVVAQSLTIDAGAVLQVKHDPLAGFLATKESVLARATRWVISSLRESR